MTLKILIGTYNVNTRIIDKDLTSWLFSHNRSSNLSNNSCNDNDFNTTTSNVTNVISNDDDDNNNNIIKLEEKPDIIVVGLQEYTPMPYSLIKVNNKRLEHYSKLIERAISLGTNKESYTQLMKDYYVGLALFIYVKDRDFTGIINNYEISKAGVGPFWIGNKGGLGVRIILNKNELLLRNDKGDDSNLGNNSNSNNIDINNNDNTVVDEEIVLCFVVTHLTPHDHNTQRRNQDFKNICERLIFTNDNKEINLQPSPPPPPQQQEDEEGEVYNENEEEEEDEDDELIINNIISRESLIEDGLISTPLITRNNPRNKNNSIYNNNPTYNSNNNQKLFTIYDSDYLFFFGDLNYRIEFAEFDEPRLIIDDAFSNFPDFPGEHFNNNNNNDDNNNNNDNNNNKNINFSNHLLNQHHHQLRNLDQLTREFKSGKVLHGFEEGELNFLPTYKYQVGSNNEFDISGKLPGWCDRIFYYWHRDVKEEDNEGVGVDEEEEQNNNNNNNNQDLSRKEPPIKLISYLSHPSYTLSDHKPVSALFITSTLPSPHSSSFTSTSTSFSPFKIDPNRKIKFLIGEIASKILGCGWWLFGTYHGIKVCLMLVIFGIGWWLVNRF
ncbi:hypothetical protein Glove_718g25 [Diversispora epigaea]|uniref:Inositol polyphosphate-related phosphatase domain-containing protein n=1 Tax=Diversispora epigaea TaxID=1348612 RepID=A0A397G5G6_9GLOM|nr:hypothetical protein Glove_718g25 [Diversispora epigaea]